MPIWAFVLIIVVIETLTATRMVMLEVNNGVATMAHLGGLLFGFLYVHGAPMWERVAIRITRLRPRRTETDERRLDNILDKVHRKGMHSLSWGERRFLRGMSKRR